MKLLFVNENRGWFGGVEQHLADSANGLRERGHRCELAFGRDARDAERFARNFSATHACAELRSSPDPGRRDFQGILDEVQPDIIYLHKAPDELIRPWPGKVVRMVHDHDLCCPRRHKYYAWSGQVCHQPAGWRCYLDGAFLVRDRASRTGVKLESIHDKLSSMRANWELDRLLVGSRAMQQELVMNGCPAQKVRIVPPAVRWTAPPCVQAPPNEPSLLFVGQLIRGKGVDYLIHALRRLTHDFHIRIVGDGNARGGLEAQVREHGLQDRVEFLGWIPHEELCELYTETRVVVVPSRWPEPFGMVGIEAMAHARAVVGFAVGGIPDWLEDGVTGLLVPPGDTEALSSAIARLIREPELAWRMGCAGRERAQRLFQFDTLMDRLEQALEVSA